MTTMTADNRSRLWEVTSRTIVYAAIGAALYGILLVAQVPIPGSTVSVRPAFAYLLLRLVPVHQLDGEVEAEARGDHAGDVHVEPGRRAVRQIRERLIVAIADQPERPPLLVVRRGRRGRRTRPCECERHDREYGPVVHVPFFH